MDTQLQKKVENGVSFEQMKAQAEMFIKSGFFPKEINTPEKAITVMLTGRDFGLSFVESLRTITVINGKPCMSAQLLLGLCQRTGQVEQAHFEEESDQKAVFILQRKGNEPYKSVFTIDDAAKLGLANRDNWQKQPKTMLRWRAISQAVRIVFPDAISGIYTPEEMADDVIIAPSKTTGELEVTEVIVKTEQPPKIEAKSDDGFEPDPDAFTEDQEIFELGNWVLPWGKYKGLSLVQVLSEKSDKGKEKGRQYLEWLRDEAEKKDDEKSNKLYARISNFLNAALREGMIK